MSVYFLCYMCDMSYMHAVSEHHMHSMPMEARDQKKTADPRMS